MNSNMKSSQFLKYKALTPFIRIPNVIWITPIMTASFILYEFTKANSLAETDHTGSTPNGYTQFSLRTHSS